MVGWPGVISRAVPMGFTTFNLIHDHVVLCCPPFFAIQNPTSDFGTHGTHVAGTGWHVDPAHTYVHPLL